MRNRYHFTICLLVILLILVPTQSYQEEFKFYGRGHVEPSNPIFGDEFLRLLIKGDKGTIIDVVSHYGIVVIRMDLEKDQSCDDSEFIRCFKGKISELKNVDHPNVGSDISLKINSQEGIWKLSIHSGNMEGTNVLVFLENNENKSNTGNLQISWDNCMIELNKYTNKPETLKITPSVIDNSNNKITSEVKAKFRFSYDSNLSNTSHTHLDYKIIDEFTIYPNNPESIVLNITKAIEKAETEGISKIQIEKRHYTISNTTEEDKISYNNEDEIILELIKEDEKWYYSKSCLI